MTIGSDVRPSASVFDAKVEDEDEEDEEEEDEEEEDEGEEDVAGVEGVEEKEVTPYRTGKNSSVWPSASPHAMQSMHASARLSCAEEKAASPRTLHRTASVCSARCAAVSTAGSTDAPTISSPLKSRARIRRRRGCAAVSSAPEGGASEEEAGARSVVYAKRSAMMVQSRSS